MTATTRSLPSWIRPGSQLRTTSTYGALRRLLTRTDPAGGTTTFGYSPKGAPTLITDALGHPTAIENDAQGRPTRVVDPLGTVTRTTYDGSGNVLREERFDPQGVSCRAAIIRTTPTQTE